MDACVANSPEPARMKRIIDRLMSKDSLLQSGLIFSVISFGTNAGHFLFQVIVSRHLEKNEGQFGDANSTISALIPLLGLLPTIAMMAITHYIAHFKALGDTTRLQGLIVGCHKFLFRLTIASSIIAIIVIKPLGVLFHYPAGFMLATLACTLIGLWVSYGAALCQGLSWFKRLAMIGFLSMLLRLLFGWIVIIDWHWANASAVVCASIFMTLANLILLYWRKEFTVSGPAISPWNREFIHYFIVCGACVIGSSLFSKGDLLIAKLWFPDLQNDSYNRAETLAAGLMLAAGPLLTVLFTSRSGKRSGDVVQEQLKLLVLFIIALLIGCGILYLLRHVAVRILLPSPPPEIAAMVGPLGLTMVFVGLLQSLAYWALASRWTRVTMLYGLLGMSYWVVLLARGTTPGELVYVMPITAGIAFAILLAFWLRSMYRHRHPAQH
jgi:O-antigen/teichoic acid export membrane protein